MNKTKETLVKDLTIDDEYGVIDANKTIKEAALMMKELGIPDLVVIDEKQQKKVLGVLADFDIVTGLIAEGKPSESTKVTDIMYTIEPATLKSTVLDTFTRMRDLDVPIIPVVDKDKLVGVVSITDTWGYLPDKYEDQKGLIPVNNPRLANYIFSISTIIVYLFMGILSPLIGISELLTTSAEGFTRGDTGIWITISIYSILIIILGIISTILILQWAYADYSSKKESTNWKYIGFIIGVVSTILILILFVFFIFSGYEQFANSTTNIFGLVLGILGLVFLILSISRDFVFRDASSSVVSEES